MGYHNPQQFSNLRIITSTQLTWCYLSLPLCPASKAQLLTHQARPVEAHQEQMDKLLETFSGYLCRWQKTKRNPNGTSQVVPRQYHFSGEHLGSLPTLQRRAFPSPLTMVETQQHSRSGWRRAPQLFTPQKVGSPGTFIHLGLQTASAKRTTYTCSSGCKGQAGHLPHRAETQTNVGEEIEEKIFFFFSSPALHPHRAEPAEAKPSRFKPGPRILTPEICLHSQEQEKKDPASPTCLLPHTTGLTSGTAHHSQKCICWIKPSPPPPHDGFSPPSFFLPKSCSSIRWLPRTQKGALIFKTARV